jgi:hypothetical protein
VLGKSITYEQQSMEDFYKASISHGLSHSLVYNFLSGLPSVGSDTTTPQVAVVIGRPLRTLKEWPRENAIAFQ